MTLYVRNERVDYRLGKIVMKYNNNKREKWTTIRGSEKSTFPPSSLHYCLRCARLYGVKQNPQPQKENLIK